MKRDVLYYQCKKPKISYEHIKTLHSTSSHLDPTTTVNTTYRTAVLLDLCRYIFSEEKLLFLWFYLVLDTCAEVRLMLSTAIISVIYHLVVGHESVLETFLLHLR